MGTEPTEQDSPQFALVPVEMTHLGYHLVGGGGLLDDALLWSEVKMRMTSEAKAIAQAPTMSFFRW